MGLGGLLCTSCPDVGLLGLCLNERLCGRLSLCARLGVRVSRQALFSQVLRGQRLACDHLTVEGKDLVLRLGLGQMTDRGRLGSGLGHQVQRDLRLGGWLILIEKSCELLRGRGQLHKGLGWLSLLMLRWRLW